MTTLSPDQQAASDAFMDFLMSDGAGEMAIEGHAGTGKSFLTKHLLKTARDAADLLRLLTNQYSQVNIKLTATTNKAAKVLAELAGEEAQTIHSMLKIKVFNDFKSGKTKLNKAADYKVLRNTLIIIDEAGMADSQLLEMIRESTKDCKVLYILDAYQLAPVKQRICPVTVEVKNKVKLTTIQRQLENSPIVALAEKFRKVLDGEAFPTIEAAGDIIRKVDGATFQQLIDEEFSTEAFYDPNKAKVLAWTNNRVHDYNKHIRALRVSSDKWTEGEYVITNNPLLSLNDKMSFVPTDSVIRIDDIGEFPVEHFGIRAWRVEVKDRYGFIPVDIEDYKKLVKDASITSKRDGDWQHYFQVKEGFLDLRPIHASTVHKSQGSTYGTVFIDLNDIGANSVRSEVARLLYVAMTRAAHKVVFYGNLPQKYGGTV